MCHRQTAFLRDYYLDQLQKYTKNRVLGNYYFVLRALHGDDTPPPPWLEAAHGQQLRTADRGGGGLPCPVLETTTWREPAPDLVQSEALEPTTWNVRDIAYRDGPPSPIIAEWDPPMLSAPLPMCNTPNNCVLWSCWGSGLEGHGHGLELCTVLI